MLRDRQGSAGAREPGSGSPLLPSPPASPHTLVLGLGNPILGDDGVGWRVVEEIQRTVRSPDFRGGRAETAEAVTTSLEFDCIALGGLALMERLIGYDRAIIVDAISTRDGVPGTVYRLTLDDLPTRNAGSAHDASLKIALELGRRLGAALPQEVVIIGIEAASVLDFAESLSPQVAASVGRAAAAVLAEL